MEDKMITAKEFFLDTPIYKSYPIHGTDVNALIEVLRIEFFKGPLDAYCIQCGRESVFNRQIEIHRVIPKENSSFNESIFFEDIEDIINNNITSCFVLPKNSPMLILTYANQHKIFSVQLNCIRCQEHFLYFTFNISNLGIMKIGQYPSIANLKDYGVQKYRKILGNSLFRELTKAIGLNAHGVGIGAFVYLRRIFEDLIEKAHSEATKNPTWDENGFIGIRMDEKILKLKDLLPEFLVENRALYSILSTGIHSLTEEECLKYFSAVRTGIELILDAKAEEEEKNKKISIMKQTIASIKGELKSK